MTSRLMRGAPPASDQQVTFANWRKAPYNRWAFSNVRRVLPTAPIPPSRAPRELTSDPLSVAGLSFAGPDGAERLVRQTLVDTCTDGMIVLRGGRVAFEWYDGHLDAERVHVAFSVSKSIAGTAAGILVDRDIVDPEALVTKYIPELDRSAYADATVRHVLDMVVGVSYDEDYVDPAGDVASYRVASGWAPAPIGAAPTDLRSFLTTLRPSGVRHGEVFHYVSPNTDVLGWVLERASGQHYSEILARYLWGPMGAALEANLALDRLGCARTAGGFSASLRDLARVGEMMRNRGFADGRSVVPGWWIDDIRRNGDRTAWSRGKFVELFPDAAYRSKWYSIAPSVFCAVGVHGQWIYIDEEAETVIARFSSQPTAMDFDTDRLWLRGYDAICKAISR